MSHSLLKVLRVILTIVSIATLAIMVALELEEITWLFAVIVLWILWYLLPRFVLHEEHIRFRGQQADRYILSSFRYLSVLRGIIRLLSAGHSSFDLFCSKIYTTPKGIFYGTWARNFVLFEDVKHAWSGGDRAVRVALNSGVEFVISFSSLAQRRSFMRTMQTHGVQASTGK